MDYLIRFIQVNESFRQAETEAIADLLGIKLSWKSYTEDSPFAVVRFEETNSAEENARRLISRSITSSAIFELWGIGSDIPCLHEDVRKRTSALWCNLRRNSFRFDVDSFRGSRSARQRHDIIESFSYMGFEGPIVMSKPDLQFTVFEHYALDGLHPEQVYLGRLVTESGRKAVNRYNLKKRNYIATTSMDAELSLITANMAQAAPGKLVFDPFMGTGSFPLACAHFGAYVFGGDLDGRSIRGKPGRNVASNFKQYGTSAQYLGGFVADLTNSPVGQKSPFLDAVICDPPYGVREGLKVLGSTRAALQEVVLLSDGTPAHLQDNYVPPKKPYSFARMLDDILDFSSKVLVEGGRLCMWMPVAGSADASGTSPEPSVGIGGDGDGERAGEAEYAIPRHPMLELLSVSRQDFNKWSRRLLTYRRRRDQDIAKAQLSAYQTERAAQILKCAHSGTAKADDLNAFRKMYFQGFKA